jgi:hypothetical protein
MVQIKRAKGNRSVLWSGAPDCPVCHRTVSGVPPDSVRCTREPNFELATFGNSGSRSAIIHRTVLCSTGLSYVAPDYPVRQRSNGYTALTVVCKNNKCATVRAYACRSQDGRQKAHRTVNNDCPVHHRTVRWPRSEKLQRSNPNGRVTWLAHRTVSGGTPDCPVRHATTASTNGQIGGWGYKYPQPPTIHCIQVFSLPTSYKSYNIQYKTQSRDQILSQVQRQFQSNSD